MNKNLHKRLKKAAATLLMSPEVRKNARDAWQLLEDMLPEASKAFFQFLEQNDWLDQVEQEHRQLLINRQSNHWILLFKADFSDNYVESAVNIGLEHAKFNISPSNYVFGCTFMMNILMREINEVLADNPRRALELTQAINSLMLIDMSLVLSLYNNNVVILD